MEITTLNIILLVYLIIAIYTAGLTAGRAKLSNEKKLEDQVSNIEIIIVSLFLSVFAPVLYIWAFIEWLKQDK